MADSRQVLEWQAQAIINSALVWEPINKPVNPDVLHAAKEKVGSLPDGKRQKVQAQLDILSQQVSIDTPSEIASLFEGARSSLMQKAPEIANAIMDDEIKKWKWPPITPIQKENIKLAIIDRIASGVFAQVMIGGIQQRLQSITEKFSKIDIKNISNIWQIDNIVQDFSVYGWKESQAWKSKSMEEKITEQIVQMMREGLGEMQKAHETNPQPEWYTLLLSHPKALANYSFPEDIPTLLAKSWDPQITKQLFKSEIQKKILGLDAKIVGMQATKEKILDSIARVPDQISGQIFDMMKWIFQIKIFGKFAAAFLWFDNPDTAIDELKIESKQRKSIHALVSYGTTRNERWEIINGENTRKIGVLKHIDFTGVNFEKLKPFMKKMKSERVDVSKSDFWKSVFLDGKIETWEGDKKKTLTFPKWDEGKETTESILTKLNGQKTMSASIPPSYTPLIPWDNPREWVASVPPAWALGDPARTVEVPPSSRTDAISRALLAAKSLPFDYTFGGKTEKVSAHWDILTLGDMQWSIAGKWPMGIEFSAKSIGIDSENIVLNFPVKWVKKQPKWEFIQSIPTLLEYSLNKKNEVIIPDLDDPNNPDTLIITRTA